MSTPKIVIAGDVPVDSVLFPHQGEPGLHHQIFLAAEQHRRDIRGGTSLISDLLRAAPFPLQISSPDLPPKVLRGNDVHASIGFITKAVTSPETGSFPYSFGFRLKKPFTWERRCEWLPATSSDNGLDSPKILILQDTNGKFTNEDCAVQFFRQVRPAWVIYHMQLPLGSGDIWDVVRFGPFQSDAEQDPMQLIVVVTADDLRATGIELSHGLSWEKTCEDFVLNLGSHSQTDTLATCAHLVVLFGCDGVIYHRGRGADQQTLFYDPRRLKGDFAKQHMEWLPGVTEAFTAGMSANIAQDPSGGITDSIFFGLKTARRLMQHGYQLQDQDGLLTCSADRVMNSVWPDDNIASVVIPSEDICGALNPHWTILELAAPSPLEVARQIVEFGSPVPARQIPMARFGSLYLYDRGEIEQFQWIYHLIEEYLDGYRDTPLNIALFGPGGSGKRFAGVEVVKAACQSRRTQQLSFNLSQFQKVEDLRAAFRSIRDSCLDGCISVVYLKGFDTDFSDRPMGWISELLSCLGRNPYCDNGRVQAIGRAILLFEAASSATFREFGRRTRSSDAAQRARQGSEFISHLHGFVDVLGPDRREPSDNLFTVRRAVLLRALLEDKTSNLIDNERLRVDDDILDGLLLVSKFHDGARSLRALLEMCKLSRCSVLHHLGLPPPSQMSMHVDYDEFTRCVECQNLCEDLREDLAEKLHNIYRRYRVRMAKSEEEKTKIKQEVSLSDWNLLREDMRESARAQVEDIPRKLRMVSCFLDKRRQHLIPVDQFTRAEIDLLAEGEHGRWNAERFRSRWRLGARKQVQRSSPLLIPWRDLEKV